MAMWAAKGRATSGAIPGLIAMLVAAPVARATAEGDGSDAPAPPARTSSDEGRIQGDIDRLDRAVASLAEGLSFSGFFVLRAETYALAPNAFSLGAFELDLEKQAGAHAQFAAALVLDSSGATLPVGFVDLHMAGGAVSPRGYLWLERGFHVQAGRFDLPFANDWRYAAPNARPTVRQPVTTSEVLDGGLNDVGVRAYGSLSFLNLAGWVVRGTGTGNALGLRLGFAPFDAPYSLRREDHEQFELALSYQHDFDAHLGTDQRLGALDLDGHFGPLHVRAELLGRADADLTDTWGFQTTLALTLSGDDDPPLVLFARHDGLLRRSAGETGFAREQRLAAGVAWTTLEVADLRAECLRAVETDPVLRLRPGFLETACAAELVVSY